MAVIETEEVVLLSTDLKGYEEYLEKLGLTCSPTSYHFLVESFYCFGLMRPSVASVDFGHIHVA